MSDDRDRFSGPAEHFDESSPGTTAGDFARPTPIVVAGCGASGLPALSGLLAAFGRECPFAVLAVCASTMGSVAVAEAIRSASRLQVIPCGPQSRQPILPGRVYVIPADQPFTLDAGTIAIGASAQAPHCALDLCFRHLASASVHVSAAIVLSGEGTAGAEGLGAIKEAGAVTFAQRPTQAERDAMPRAAIATGNIDWVLPVAEIATRIARIRENASLLRTPSPERDEPAGANRPPDMAAALPGDERALRDVLAVLHQRTGHDFACYKRATIIRRLQRRLQVHGLPHFAAYHALLQNEPEEAKFLLADLLIGVTNFFRDAPAFEALGAQVIDPLFAAGLPEQVRVWVPGCATGQEAYSIAILLSERAALLPQSPRIQVFATDIDEHALMQARAAKYPTAIEADVDPTRLRRWFESDGPEYRIRKEVRDRVMFAVHNLLRDPPFSRLDLISCRNLLIYLDRSLHAQVLEMFHFALRPNGYLFLGTSESAETPGNLFLPVDKKSRIYRSNPAARATRKLPVLPFVQAAAAPRAQPGRGQGEPPPTYEDIHRDLATQYSPPIVLVDEDGNVLYLSRQAGQYLRISGGKASLHLPSLVAPELRFELRSAISQALREREEVRTPAIVTGSGPVRLLVRPVEPANGARFLMVLFEPIPDEGAAIVSSSSRDQIVLGYEQEIARLKDQLQGTVEDSETAQEELKAANEELQAINEELRSTTEELETSQEELQSINQELYTVNGELKAKLGEMAKVTDDLQNFISSTDVATVFVDRGMSIKRYTPQAAKLFNLIPTDIGRSLLDITHRLDYPTLADDAARVFQTLSVIEREVSSREGRWYLARVLPYRTLEDRIEGAVLTFIDITSRRRAQENARLIAEQTKDYAIITTDVAGRIQLWNNGAERLYGYVAAEVIGKRFDLLFTPDDQAAAVPTRVLAIAEREGRCEDDRWHQRKDGSRFFTSGITMSVLEAGEVRGFATITRDFTGQQRAMDERERRLQEEATGRAEAQAASATKDEFLAVLSHELKGPLNLIMLKAQLLARRPEAAAVAGVAADARTIYETGLAQARIIDDLLDLSRMSTGKLALTFEPVDWAADLQRFLDLARYEARKKGLNLAMPPAGEKLIVRADRVRLEQVTWNLVSNAIKFTPAGGSVTIRLTCEGAFGRLEVEDTGRGIAPALLPNVFDMFRQGSATGEPRSGLGIGLALVKQLSEGMGGRVAAHSDGPDRGARFTVWIPLWREDGAGMPGLEAAQGGLAGRRVLVVDPEEQSTRALRELLGTEGLVVHAASNLREAIDACRSGGLDIVLAEWELPGADARALLAELRSTPTGSAAIPVVVMTRSLTQDREREITCAGFDGYVSKPIAFSLLIGELLRAIDGRPARAPGR